METVTGFQRSTERTNIVHGLIAVAKSQGNSGNRALHVHHRSATEQHTAQGSKAMQLCKRGPENIDE